MTWAFSPLLPAAAERLGALGEGGNPGPIPVIGGLLVGGTAAALEAAVTAATTATAGLTTAIPLTSAASAACTLSADLTVLSIGHAWYNAPLPSIGSLLAPGAMTCNVQAASTVSPSLTTAIPLAADVAAVVSIGSLDVTTSIRLVAASQAVTLAAADLTAISNAVPETRGWQLPGAWFVDPGWAALYWPNAQGLQSPLAGSGILAQLQAAVSGAVTGAGNLTTAIPLQAASASVTTITADTLNIGAALFASSASVCFVAPDLGTEISLAADVTTSATASGTLFDPGVPQQFAADVGCSVSVTADLTNSIVMAADVQSQVTNSADFAAVIAFIAIVQAQADAAADLETVIALEAEIDGVVTMRPDFNYNVRPLHDSRYRIGIRREDDYHERIGKHIGRKRRIG